jgi:uncharacterized membrane protein
MMMARGSLPLPPPALLSDYNKVVPGLVEKIVQWTGEQREHRMKLETLVTTGAESRMNRGQLIASGVAIVGLILAALEGIVGNPYVATVIAIVCVGGPTAAVYLARGTTGTSSPQPAPSSSKPTKAAPERGNPISD